MTEGKEYCKGNCAVQFAPLRFSQYVLEGPSFLPSEKQQTALFSPKQVQAGLPRWLSGKESTCQYRRCRRRAFIPGSGRSPGEGNGSPLQYSCLGNPMDRGAWLATVCGVAKSRTRLSPQSGKSPGYGGSNRSHPCG